MIPGKSEMEHDNAKKSQYAINSTQACIDASGYLDAKYRGEHASLSFSLA